MRKLHIAVVSVVFGGGALVSQGLGTGVSAAGSSAAGPIAGASYAHKDEDAHHCGCHGAKHHEGRDAEHHDEHRDGGHDGQRESQNENRLIVIDIEHLLR
jgi:hypothetical protein